MAIDCGLFESWTLRNRERFVDKLCRYIAIDTTSPHEDRAFAFLHQIFREVGAETWEEPIAHGTFSHPERCPAPMSHLSKASRNFKAGLPSTRSASTHGATLVSCHIDVVPGGQRWPGAFTPFTTCDAGGGVVVHGRGACDNKGNLVMLIEALRYLREAGIEQTRTLLFDGVIEEEIGGAGALSSGLGGAPDGVEGVLVLEPTNLKVYRGHRGCLGVSIFLHQDGAHMGASTGKAGLAHIIGPVVEALGSLEAELIAAAQRDPAFAVWQRPVQVNVGRIEGGEWHGTAMQSCRLMVNVGFPLCYGLDGIAEKVRETLDVVSCAHGITCEIKLDGLRNEAYLNAADTRFQRDFLEALNGSGLRHGSVSAWNVSCDARLYARLMGLPTLIFGCGHLEDAHSSHEKLAVADLEVGIFALANYFSAP